MTGIGVGNFGVVQRIFFDNFRKFARKTFIRPTFPLQIFCRCLVHSIFLCHVAIGLNIRILVFEVSFLLTQLKKVHLQHPDSLSFLSFFLCVG